MGGISAPRPLCAEDDRAGFDCGRASLNMWFQRHAWRNQAADISRVNVICHLPAARVAGFVALSTAQIVREHLPRPSRRNKPVNIPVVLLGQLAVDREFQNQGLAKSLLYFALKTVTRMSRDVGCYGVITHPLDDSVRAFYSRHGFHDVPFDPARSMIVRTADLTKSGF